VSSLSARDLNADARWFSALLEIVSRLNFLQPPAALLQSLLWLRDFSSIDCLVLDLRLPSRRWVKAYVREGAEWPAAPVDIGNKFTEEFVWKSQTALSIGDLTLAEPNAYSWLRDQGIRSYCAFPLTTLHERLGVVGFGSRRPYAFSDEEVHFLKRLSEISAVALNRTLSRKTLEQERARLRLLVETADPALRTANLRELIAVTLAALRKWAPREYIGLYVYDGNTRSLRLHMPDPTLAEKMAPHGLADLHGTLAGQVFRTGKTTVLDHAGLSKVSLGSVKRGTALGVKSLCMVPLMTAKGPVGVLKLASRKSHSLRRRDIELLEQVAATTAPSLDRAQSATHAAVQTTGDRTSPEGSSGAGEVPLFPQSLAAVIGSSIHSQGGETSFAGKQGLGVLEELLGPYLSASKVGLCIFDKQFRYLAVNETLAEMKGVPAPEHLGRTVREVLGDLAEVIEPQLQRVVSTGQPVLNVEVSSLIPTRSEVGHWINYFLPIKNAAGEVHQIGAIVVEITKQKRLEESLREVSEILREEKKRHQVMAEVTSSLAAKWDPEQTFRKISGYLRRVLHQEYAALAVRDEKTGKLIRHAMDFPLGKNPKAGEAISTAKTSGERALQQRSPLILTSTEVQHAEPDVAPSLLSEGIKSLCCVPLVRPEHSLGVLVLGSTRQNAFRTEDLTLLSQVASQLTIALENASIAQEVKQLRRKLDKEKSYLEGEIRTPPQFEEIVGESSALTQTLEHALVVAPSDATVLLLGETGTGKGLVAQGIHRMSSRSGRNFITLNCAAIPTGLLESELFGHEKGAFTGAVNQKLGRLELADHGTLFLDEIGEIPTELQPKLLRVLQDHEFERLGGIRTIKVNLRLIAATNRDLSRSVAAKEFRHDLFYRLNVFPIRMPSLRERREDIPVLVRYFVRRFAERMKRVIETIPTETMDALIRWHWPGNVRELENFIERSVILTEGTALAAPLHELEEPAASAPATLEHTEREHIIRILRESHGMISGAQGAAKRLGMKRTTLQSKMQKLGIVRQNYSS
jgi:formate hydrogenlyase transcriptional activator